MWSIKIGLIATIAATALASCESVDIHTIRAYDVPDASLANTDEATRVAVYEAEKMSYESSSSLAFSQDIFMQKYLQEKDEAYSKGFWIFGRPSITSEKFPPEKVVVKDLFRLDEEALSAYKTGKKYELKKDIAKMFGSGGLSVAVGATSVMLVDGMITVLGFLLYPQDAKPDDGFDARLTTYSLVTCGGLGVAAGGLIIGSRFNKAKRTAYLQAADYYNEYLRSFYNLEGRP